MRICMPETHGWRGAGLANEMNGWAKAYIASRVLNAHLLQPAWGLNARGYRSYFKTPRCDWIYQAALRKALPLVRLSEEDFGYRYGRDFRDIVIEHATRHNLFNRRHYAFVTGGMWGGIGMLREAFPFIRSVLLSAEGTASNLGEIDIRIAPEHLRIAVHVRRGDFLPETDLNATSRRPWNTATPLEWYLAVCRTIRQNLRAPHTFLLLTDGHERELEPLLSEIQPLTTMHQPMNICSDLLAMADADLLITSCSSFSLWAAALSGSPYIWHAGNLVEGRDASHAIWEQGTPLSGRMAPSPRGIPVEDDGQVDASLFAYLEGIASRRGWGNDLVFYGRVRS